MIKAGRLLRPTKVQLPAKRVCNWEKTRNIWGNEKGSVDGEIFLPAFP
jgi:hypothetical protein